MLTKASRIAAISSFSRQEAIKHGADPDRIRAIPINMIRSPKAKPIEQPPLNLVSGRFFLYPANLWRHKNHEVLINAFAMARQQALPSDLKLVCTGDGVDRLEPLRELAEQLGLAESVLLPGFVCDSDLEGLYQHALAMVFPALYEGFGMPIIEAMASGLPVTCSETTALKEVAGEAALLFHPGNPQQIANALSQLARDPTLRHELIERGLSQAEIYAQPAVMAQKYWELFQEAHAAKPAG
jgi:glycosyltransferase involved in cell wall biosynthesis